MQSPSKREVMLALLEKAEARVHLDARRPGVELPPKLLAEGHVRLDYGYRFTPPIPDLLVDEEGIHATLSFSRAPFHTFVPWGAVYLIADFDGNGAVWQEDIPADLLAGLADGPRAPTLKPVVCAEPSPSDSDDEPPEPGKKPRPPWLKIVK